MRIMLGFLSIGILLASTTAVAQDQKQDQGQDKGKEIEFANSSRLVVGELYLSPPKENQWGEDRLGDAVIESGASIRLKGVQPGRHDVKIVDEEGDECVIDNVQITADEKVVITDQNLIGCQTGPEELEGDEPEEQ